MNTFWKYYFGEAVALYPTIFIGGNHEASNYLWELYYGGWATPNIYFLGFAGVVKFRNLRIGVYFIAYLLLDTLRGLLIMVILSGQCIMFASMIFTNSCKLRNQSIFFFHMIALLASLIVGTGRNLFGKNQILRWR